MSKVMAIVAREIREAVPALLFFLVVFHMILITKNVLLKEYHITTTGAATSWIAVLSPPLAGQVQRTIPGAPM